VKVTRAKDLYVLQLGKRENHLLLELLKLYPRIPPAHHRLSKTAKTPDQESNQRLLDEALADQRAQNKRNLETLLKDPKRMQATNTGCRLLLSAADLEWVLQILNDIRVGSWIMLGSPEAKIGIELLNDETAPHFWAMEMSGFFQMYLLEALNP